MLGALDVARFLATHPAAQPVPLPAGQQVPLAAVQAAGQHPVRGPEQPVVQGDPLPFLRRAVSSAYYAMFHYLAGQCADLFVGCTEPIRQTPQWLHVFRSLEHGVAKAACEKISKNRDNLYAQPIKQFATLFVSLQEARHDADYNPQWKIAHPGVIQWIGQADAAIADVAGAPEADRKALLACAIFRGRKK